ncbi:hypothetical protein CY35_02G014700 [Sphagnum magellanicum]|nr:hypothetical protein CY35_02G014700 [Sphagnum magellanicum]
MAMATMMVIGRSSWQQGMMHYVRQQHPWSMHMQRFSFSRMSQLQRWDQLELSTKPIVFQATLQLHPFFKQSFYCYGNHYGSVFVRQKSQRSTWPEIFPFAARPYAERPKGERIRDELGSEKGSKPKGRLKSAWRFLRRILKLALAALSISTLVLVGGPSFISLPVGLNAVLYLMNVVIPGTISVGSASLGWTMPACLKQITLTGVEGKTVLSIVELETQSPLWSLIAGRSGLGDSIITSPTINLQKDPETGQSYLALALFSIQKLQETNPYVKKNFRAMPSAEVAWSATAQVPLGSLKVVNGKLTVPGDVAAVVGDVVNCDVALGFFDQSKQRLELLQPMKAEMNLSPAVGKFYLARINPLLGEIVGLANKHSDLPDVTIAVTPAEMAWPAENYFIHIEPIKVTLARGQLVDKVLALLPKQDLDKDNQQLTMQTSAIEATVHVDGHLSCSQVDLLIADKVHVATWGLMDHIQETMTMTLAIPGTSLRDLLGLSKLPSDFNFKIPIRGTFDQPQVDWIAAARGIAQLTAHQKLGTGFISSIIQQFDDMEIGIPNPIGVFPWAPT